MEFIGNNVSTLVQITKGTSVNNVNSAFNRFGTNFGQNFVNDNACSSIPDLFNKLAGIDLTMDNKKAVVDLAIFFILLPPYIYLALRTSTGSQLLILFRV